MKIGFFTDYYLPSGFGVEISIETFRKSLEATGHHVYIFAPHFPSYKDTNPYVLRFRSLKAFKKPEMRFAFSFLPVNHLNRIWQTKLDIVHAQSPFSLGLLGKFVANQQKIPILYTHHTDYPEYAKYYIREKFIAPYLAKVLITGFSNFCDGVIAPSPKIKKYLIDYGVKKPIYILPTGVNLQFFKKSSEIKKDFKKKLKIAPETKILLFVGRMGKEKNVEFLIRAFKEVLKRAKLPLILLMVGDGPYLEKLRQLSEHLKISHSIRFIGQVPHQTIPQYYQIADLFVFASITDTQGIVILEAAASGLPIVAIKDEAFKEFVIGGKNGFLIMEASPKIFATKILEVIEKPVLYKKFTEASLAIAHQFSEKKQAEKLMDIYQNLIRKKHK